MKAALRGEKYVKKLKNKHKPPIFKQEGLFIKCPDRCHVSKRGKPPTAPVTY